MITADTITDEQIRELREQLRQQLAGMSTTTHTYEQFVRVNYESQTARVALGEKRARRGDSRAKARARCAEILNARSR